MGMYTNLVGDEKRPGVLNKTLVALALLAVTLTAMAVVGSPVRAQESTSNTITVNSLDDVTNPEDGDCTLREAITSANTDKSSGDATNECAAGSSTDPDRIVFSVTGTVNLTSALPDLSSNVRIEAPGADQLTVERNTGGDYRIFTVTSGGVVSISGITIAGGNVPDGDGGGVRNNGGTLTISDSTIKGNSAGNGGGGVFSDTDLSGPKTTITNSTISGNSATSRGGGVYNKDGLSVIENSTITNNAAPNGFGSGVASSGNTATHTKILSTIVAANQGTDVELVSGDEFNSFDSNGYNLIGDGMDAGAFNQTGDQSGVGDPKLGLLANNGGPTQTHALLSGSPAIDVIPQGTNGCGTTFTQDQRGVSRPQGSGCDVGAFELKGPLTVNSTADTDDGACTGTPNGCTLREAINDANTSSGPDRLFFNLGGSATIKLASELPMITDAERLTIDGQNAHITISGEGLVRVFKVNVGAGLALGNLTITNGLADDIGGGGGILNLGTLAVSDSTISANRAAYARYGGYGGGISNTGTATVNDSTISGNSAVTAGGISNDGTLTVSNSTLAGNSADAGRGGGIGNNPLVRAKATLENTIVAGSPTGGDCTGSITDGGYNLSSDSTCGFKEATSLSEKDPKLGDLADNGGPTETHALLTGSPALDQGKAFGTTTDQRGETRPFDLTNLDNAPDGDGSDIGAFELNNRPPAAVADDYASNEDAPLTVSGLGGVLANDTDPDTGDTLEAGLVSGPSNADSFTLNADGSFSYTPKADYNGPDSFTYKANDGTDDSNTATVNITVSPVNDDPVANPDSIDVAEDTPTVLDVLANDTDADGDSLEVSGVIISSLKGGWHLKDGQLTYTPPKDFTGTEELDYEVTDNHGGFDTASVKINVTPVNDAPTARDASLTTAEDTPKNITLGASDVEGDALTYSIVGGPAHGKLTGSGANQVYTPDKNYNGPDSFTFKTSDGTANSNVATVSISVTPVNDAPTISVVAGSGSPSACLGDTSGRITLKLSDVDSNLGDLKTSVASSSDTRLVPKSNVAFGGTGGTPTATISAVPGRTGSSTVTITVSDGQASSSVPVTVKAGGNGNDTLGGTSGADLLLGQNGDDRLSGSGASDVLCGANGNDRLTGGAGPDTFDGGLGTDAATDYNTIEGDARTNIP